LLDRSGSGEALSGLDKSMITRFLQGEPVAPATIQKIAAALAT
jgi:hypothetical protein